MSADLSQLSQLLLSNLPYESLLATVGSPPDTVAPCLVSRRTPKQPSTKASPTLSPELLLSLGSSRPGRKRKDAPPVDPVIAAQSRTLRNRFAAQRSRERKRQRQEQLEYRNQQLEEENTRLYERLDGMRERIRMLQQTLDTLSTSPQTRRAAEWSTRMVTGLGTPAVRVRHTPSNAPTIATPTRRKGRGNAAMAHTALAPVSSAGDDAHGLNEWCGGRAISVCSPLRNPVASFRVRPCRPHKSLHW
jgi:hypothetical protein